ncbi:MAG: hydrogenase/urease maturation nickel metallochaperone HypA [Nanoarchaeota archaeon]|nr:hydrogenase/urease maturation nickel metallochaperone HypA [Nanoarchaeota archaeon]
MHEHRFLQQIIEQVKQFGVVKQVKLAVGELADVEADHLQEHLSELAPWKVVVESEESKVFCACGFAGRARILDRGHDFCLFNCPQCGKKPTVIIGDAVRIVEID